MNWFWPALIPPALWAATNHLDKFLVSKYFKGSSVGALAVFSSLIGWLAVPIIALLKPEVTQIEPRNLLIIINGFIYGCAVIPYLYALDKEEASTAVPIFQLVPVFIFILSYFLLGETLTKNQIIGGLLIIVGAITISLEIITIKRYRLKKTVFMLMALSSFLFALAFTLFKLFALESDFWTTSFWEYLGLMIFATFLLAFIKPYRSQFLTVVKNNRASVLAVNSLNEVINISAKMIANFATLLAPIALVSVVGGFQPLFVMLYGIILTLFFPWIGKESLLKTHLFQKALAITIILVGTLILNS